MNFGLPKVGRLQLYLKTFLSFFFFFNGLIFIYLHNFFSFNILIFFIPGTLSFLYSCC